MSDLTPSAPAGSAPERVPGTVDAELLEKCRRLDALPANAPGADKTWVLLHMRAVQRLLAGAGVTREQELESARRALAALDAVKRD